ncbi:hypothetical protein C7212DRAFT_362338 [Tuber magnatum]|uniref:Uncharacterized protein n=1 Tax=Tuber magnatum TaxID=42249 RepID=A0A317SSG6_9PEZI|nr:hypothetical protein C7212DRAFT_362338 [Tuber magnatum]
MTDSPSKIKAPSTKIYDIPAGTVWGLLGVSRKAKNEIDRKIRAVWDKYLKDQEDQFSKLPRDLVDKATEELVRELPEIFGKCEGTWFATWAFFNRHKGRFREPVKKNPAFQAESSENESNQAQVRVWDLQIIGINMGLVPPDETIDTPEVETPAEE